MGSLNLLARREEAVLSRNFHTRKFMACCSNLDFAGGIGQNDVQVRTEICGGLVTIGVSLDESPNPAASNPVSDGTSGCQVLLFASQEDEQISRHAQALPS